MWIFSMLVGEFLNTIAGLVTGAKTLAGEGVETAYVLLSGLVLSLLVLPGFSSLLLIMGGDHQRRQVFQVTAWGLAACAGLLLSIADFSRLHWAVWGIWLYTGLAISALILEGLLLARGKRSDYA
jgi:hypothetical protein